MIIINFDFFFFARLIRDSLPTKKHSSTGIKSLTFFKTSLRFVKTTERMWRLSKRAAPPSKSIAWRKGDHLDEKKVPWTGCQEQAPTVRTNRIHRPARLWKGIYRTTSPILRTTHRCRHWNGQPKEQESTWGNTLTGPHRGPRIRPLACNKRSSRRFPPIPGKRSGRGFTNKERAFRSAVNNNNNRRGCWNAEAPWRVPHLRTSRMRNYSVMAAYLMAVSATLLNS